MNTTLKVIAERFSCRNFNNAVPSDAHLDAIAQAAIQAPSGMNRQHWQVIVIKNREILAEMEEEGMKVLAQMEDRTMYERIQERGGKLFYNAPCMILIAIKPESRKGAELIDCGILAQNVVLAASSLGIANVHCGLTAFAFAGDKAATFKAKLQFPTGYEYGLAVLLGHTDTIAAPHTPNQKKITIIE